MPDRVTADKGVGRKISRGEGMPTEKRPKYSTIKPLPGVCVWGGGARRPRPWLQTMEVQLLIPSVYCESVIQVYIHYHL